MKKIIPLLSLLLVSLSIGAQELQPLRVEVEYNQGLWLEAEYAFPIASMTLAPALCFGEFSANSVGIGIEARVYPFSSRGDGFYVAIGGVYTYDSTQILSHTLDSEKLGVGYRLILLKVLTGNLELGLEAQNDGSGPPELFYGQFGIGVAL
ncbi:MAG: hypothetical protein ABSF43_08900 [Rectinemataceae bacterium]|jgi:hypothetical protein